MQTNSRILLFLTWKAVNEVKLSQGMCLFHISLFMQEMNWCLSINEHCIYPLKNCGFVDRNKTTRMGWLSAYPSQDRCMTYMAIELSWSMQYHLELGIKEEVDLCQDDKDVLFLYSTYCNGILYSTYCNSVND